MVEAILIIILAIPFIIMDHISKKAKRRSKLLILNKEMKAAKWNK